MQGMEDVQHECFDFRARSSDPEGDRRARRKSNAAARAARSAKRKASVVLDLLRAPIWSPRGARMPLRLPLLASGVAPCWRLALRRSRPGQWPSSTSRAGDRSESSPNWPWRMSSCASASGAWRMRSLLCGGGRACEPRPVGLHRAAIRVPLGCSRREACRGRGSTSGTGGPCARGRLPAAAPRLA